MKKIKKILFIAIFPIILIHSSVFAGSENNEELSKNKKYVVNECFEGVSRKIFSFNQSLDKGIFEPLSKIYVKLPQPLRIGTSNVVSNISNLTTIPNNLLQGKVKQAGINSARFLVNTTIGILGIFDPANKMGLISDGKEDYGQTLGYWGSKSGCYFVMPIIGPTTARDFTGSLLSLVGGDPWYNVTVRNNSSNFTDMDYYLSRGAHALDFRAKNIESFDSLERNSVDFYASVKSLYLQDRQQKILNTNKITNTQDDSDWEEIKD